MTEHETHVKEHKPEEYEEHKYSCIFCLALDDENDILDADQARAYIELVGEQYAELSDMQEAYVGYYTSDVHFAQKMAEQLGLRDDDIQWPYTCIDWDKAARELMYDYSEINGHYFRNL